MNGDRWNINHRQRGAAAIAMDALSYVCLDRNWNKRPTLNNGGAERMPLTEKDRKRRRRQRRQRKLKILKKEFAEATDPKTKKELLEKIHRHQPLWEAPEE